MTVAPRTVPDGLPKVLPPGQQRADELRVRHYGRVPRIRPGRWRLDISGPTRDGQGRTLRLADVRALPHATVVADLHCTTRWTTTDLRWGGVLARTLVDLAPPADDVTHVLATAEYGYSALLRLDDLLSPRTIAATHLDGQELTPEHGWPVRLVVPHLYAWKGPKWLRGFEYLTAPAAGFWEERGYHPVGDVWREERYSHQQ